MLSRRVHSAVSPAPSHWGVRAVCSVAVETAVQGDPPLAGPAPPQVRVERFRNKKAIWRDFQKELLVQGCHDMHVMIHGPVHVYVRTCGHVMCLCRDKWTIQSSEIVRVLEHVSWCSNR